MVDTEPTRFNSMSRIHMLLLLTSAFEGASQVPLTRCTREQLNLDSLSEATFNFLVECFKNNVVPNPEKETVAAQTEVNTLQRKQTEEEEQAVDLLFTCSTKSFCAPTESLTPMSNTFHMSQAELCDVIELQKFIKVKLCETDPQILTSWTRVEGSLETRAERSRGPLFPVCSLY